MVEYSTADPYVPYGRGGAGNMRRRSSIRDAWSRISSQPNQHPLTPTSSPEEHYANSKSEPHSSLTRRRRSTNSSIWSTSTAGEHRSAWKRLFKRKSSVAPDDKIEESAS